MGRLTVPGVGLGPAAAGSGHDGGVLLDGVDGAALDEVVSGSVVVVVVVVDDVEVDDDELLAGRLGTDPTLLEVAEAARRAPPAPSPPRSIDLLLDGVATRLTDGYEASVPLLRHTLERFRDQAEGDGGVRWFWLAWILASELWDDALWDELTRGAVRVARDSGSLQQLPMALV